MGKIISKIKTNKNFYVRIPQSLLNEAMSRISLVNLIGETVTLLQVSKDQWKGSCPFHTEKTPSFFVNETKCFYHCFGCGASGNAVSFLMKMSGMSFRQASMRVFQLAGLEFYDKADLIQGESSFYRKSADEKVQEQMEGEEEDIIDTLWDISTTCFERLKYEPDIFDKIEEIYLMVDDNYRFKNYERIKYIKKNLVKIMKEKINDSE